MSKVEKELTDAEILEWATKDMVVTSLDPGVAWASYEGIEPLTNNAIIPGVNFGGLTQTDRYSYSGNFGVDICRYENDNNRKIGYIDGVNDDGSFKLYILGNGVLNVKPTHWTNTYVNFGITGEGRLLPPASEYYYPENPSDFGPFLWDTLSHDNYRLATAQHNGQNVAPENAFELLPEWVENEYSNRTGQAPFVKCGKKGNNYIYDNISNTEIALTNDIETTLKIGEPLQGLFFQRSQAGIYIGDKNIGGDLFDVCSSITLTFASTINNLPFSLPHHDEVVTLPNGTKETVKIFNNYPPMNGFMAFNYTPYNLILTYDLDAAKNYINTGELPEDAFLYPFDVDNIPVNTDGGTGAEDSDGTQGTVDTEDTTWEETDDQSPSAPGQNGQSLTNNNLYWLTSQQLKNFLDWFWDEATDVSDPSELFEKIQGLYENLSEAIVAVRYMPVRPEWIGGVSTDTKIIVGMLEKAEQCRVINKVVPDIQTIGSIDISELAKGNKTWDGFLNYSPYCQMSLYLPFHGFIDLDADLIMNSKLTIKAAYDILTGTIQYFIYRTARGADNLNLVNTVVAKMATDIPISLQTKTQRDSAIFQNVSSAAGNLIGAGASLATGNPIGMVMSTANIAATQPTGAPLTLKGTISENGAYYDSALCAIYVKRPGINIPSNYDRKVGNPCNVAMKLSQVHGFVKCENPFISFSEVTSDNSLGFPPPKPTKDEIDTIYNALSEGVILP